MKSDLPKRAVYLVREDSREWVRGPYKHLETAGAVRQEMERDEYWSHVNLQIIFLTAVEAESRRPGTAAYLKAKLSRSV